VKSATRLTEDDLFTFAVGTALDQGGRFVLNVVAASVLGPVVFGTWVVLSLLIQYSNFLSFGIPQGAGREIPRALGARDGERADRIEDVATAGTVLTSLLGAGLAALLAPLVLGPSDAAISPASVVLFVLVVMLQQFMVLQQVLFRSRLRFRPAAVQLGAQGTAALIAGGLFLALGSGLDGLLLARVAIGLVAILLVSRTLARVPRPHWDSGQMSELIRIGAPMLIAGILVVLLVTVDRWIVLLALGDEAVGQYGLVGLVVSTLVLVPNLVSQLRYPRLAFARGEGQSPEMLGRLARSQGVLAGSLTALASVAAAVAAIIGIPLLLPAYEPAMEPIIIVLVGMTAYAFASGFGNLLNLLDRQRRYLQVQLAALLINVGLAIALVRAGLGLNGVALASAIGLTSYALLLRIAASAALRRHRAMHDMDDVRPVA
jgi:O-antigen/teichoic acid export membrane protein